MPPIVYAGAASLTVKGGSGTNTFNVINTSDASPVTVVAGTGANTINATPGSEDIADLAGALTIQGNGGQTILNIDDQLDPFSGNSYTLTSSTVASVYSAPITYSGIQGVTLNGSSRGSTYYVLSTNPGTPVSVTGGAGNDTFNIGSHLHVLDSIRGPLAVDGGSGTDTVNLFDQGELIGQDYTLTPNSLSRPGVGPINFTHVSTVAISAGSGSDTLTMVGSFPKIARTKGLAPIVTKLPSTNLITVKPPPPPVTLLGTSILFNGGAGSNTVVGPDTVNTWSLTGVDTGSIYNLTFSRTQNLMGGSDADTFQFAKGAAFAMIDGGAGTATLDYSNLISGVVVNLATNTVPGTHQVAHIHTVIGTPGNDNITGNLHADTTIYGNGGMDVLKGGGDGHETYVLAANQTAGTLVTGGSGVETLVGADAANTWAITGSDAGTVNGITTFSNIANLVGGALFDSFQLHNNGNVASIDGGAGNNKLSYGYFTGAVTVNLQTTVATGVGTFTNIQTISGNGLSSTLIGTDAPATWVLKNTNAGTVAGITFTGFANLTGGAGADTFQLGLRGVTGTIDGGGGVNSLDYSAFMGNLLVDLPLGLATHVGGSIKNIQIVTGGAGTAILVGNGTGNTLTAGTGRSILIAGSAAATLIGGPDEDVLVGGTTSFDTNVAALNALMAEWSLTSLPYATRVNHLLHGGGLNGATLLNTSTFQSNGGGNTLTGGAGLDLFFGKMGSDSTDLDTALGELFIAV
jgi:hypothetical protein